MKKFKSLLSLLLVALMLLSLTACGGKSSTTSTPGAAEGTKDEAATTGTDAATGTETTPAAGGKVLNVQFDVEVASMDPQIATDGTSFEVQAAVTEGLYSIDAAGAPIFAMAESVEKSDDGLTYTFHLRDANWSNGTPVTASDFIFAWKDL